MAGTAPSGGRSRAPISAINITPLVDLMLVLLVIMMVASTYIVRQSIKVELPQAKTSDGQAPKTAKVVVTAGHEFLLDDRPVTEAELITAFKALVAADPNATLVVTADKQADHGDVVHVLDLARSQSLTHFALAVERVRGE